MRPVLTKEISRAEFLNYYWLKKELQDFCKLNAIGSVGSKQELTERIAYFLETGIVVKMKREKRPPSRKEMNQQLELNTIIDENHRCSQKAREFFKSVIGPHFHFSTYIQNYFKNNIGKTYRDAVTAWYEEEERKKDKTYKTQISPQFQYNQFIRDYFDDPANLGKTKEDAIIEWKKKKALPGSNKYIRKRN